MPNKPRPPKPSSKRKQSARPSTPAEAAQVSAAAGPKRLKLPRYRLFRRGPRIRHPGKLPPARKIFVASLMVLWQYRWLFLGIVAVYSVLEIVLVRGMSSGVPGGIGPMKTALGALFGGNLGQLSAGLAVFAYLVTSSSGSSSPDTLGQTLVVVAVSLAIIWSLRQVGAGRRPRVKDAFYQGMYPLVPFVLVLTVVGLQLLPLLIGAGLYNLVTSNGIAVYAVEKVAWALLFGALALTSLYLVSSSVFGLYIATLPDMTPLEALRSARKLVRYRRWTVLRKLAFLPMALLLLAAVIMLPVILWLTPLAAWVFFGLTMVAIAVVHSYIYALYRELLQ